MEALFRPRTLFILSALFIVYATSIPWDFEHAPSLERVSWIPLWDAELHRLPPISDLVQNVVLFMPFGFFGYLGLPAVRRRGAAAAVITLALCGMALSIFVECLQTMSVTRTPSASDVFTNTSGSLVGATAAVIYVDRLAARVDLLLDQTMRRQPGLLILEAVAAAIVLGSLAPFIPSLDVSDLRANVSRLVHHPWGVKPVGALFGDALLYAALGYLVVQELPDLLASRRLFPFRSGRLARVPVALFALALVSALAMALELAQVFIVGHSPGLEDVAAGAVGGAIGIALAFGAARGTPEPASYLGVTSRRQPAIALGFAILAPAIRALEPFELAPLDEKLAAITLSGFIPFWTLFQTLNISTFRNVFEAAMFYVPIGYVLAALDRRPWVAAAGSILLAEVLEILQIPVAGRTFDVTEGAYAAAGAIVGVHALARLRARVALRPSPSG